MYDFDSEKEKKKGGADAVMTNSTTMRWIYYLFLHILSLFFKDYTVKEESSQTQVRVIRKIMNLTNFLYFS